MDQAELEKQRQRVIAADKLHKILLELDTAIGVIEKEDKEITFKLDYQRLYRGTTTLLGPENFSSLTSRFKKLIVDEIKKEIEKTKKELAEL